jgi:hypothetical protein
MIDYQFPGYDPTIASCSASVVKIYNTASSLVRFENKKKTFSSIKKRSSLIYRQRCVCMYLNAAIVGLKPR